MTSRVDVVVPYDPGITNKALLKRATDSVSAQTVETNVIVVRGQQGVAAARNEGVDRSEHRYVAFLDADDHWKPDKLERQLDRLKETGVGLCLCGRHHTTWGDDTPGADTTEQFVEDVVFTDTSGYTSTILIDTREITTRFDTALSRREDHLFLVEATAEGGVCFVDEILSVLDKQEEGLSANTDPAELLAAHEYVFQAAAELYPFLRAREAAYFTKIHYMTAKDFAAAGQFGRASRCLANALWNGARWQLQILS